MRSESRSTQRGAMMAGNSRKRNYALLLLLALGAALLGVALLHKLRERRVAGLFHEQEEQLFALQLLLQKERDESKEVRNRLEDLKAKTISLINQKSELNNKLMEAETDVANLRRMQREMEEALQEKQNQINRVEEKAAESMTTKLRVISLEEQLKQKEAEIEEMKRRLNKKDSAPAENSSSGSDTSLSSASKEEENPQGGGAEKKVTHDQGDEKSSADVGDATQKTIEQEQPSKEGTWVQLRTEVEEDDSKSETMGENNGDESKASEGNHLEKIEISEEGESSGKKEETGLESSAVQVPEEHEESPRREEGNDETNGDGNARKEQEVANGKETERSDGSQSDNERKEGGEDSEKHDQNKLRTKRGKKRKNKTRSRRQDAELGGAAAVSGDGQKMMHPNADDATTSSALTTTDGGNGNSPPANEKQHGEEGVETRKDGREGTQVEDGTEGRRRETDEQQEQEKIAASADEKSETLKETHTDSSVLRETTASEVDDGAIKDSMSTTTSSERR